MLTSKTMTPANGPVVRATSQPAVLPYVSRYFVVVFIMRLTLTFS
jgi:hypothetical protein